MLAKLYSLKYLWVGKKGKIFTFKGLYSQMWLPRVHDYWNNPSILNVVTESWNHLCCSKINKTLYIEPERPGPISISYENIPHTAQRHLQSKAHSKLLPLFLIIRCSSLFPERYASRCILVCIFTHFSQPIMKRLKHLIFRNRGSIYQLRLDQHAHKRKFQIATKCHLPKWVGGISRAIEPKDV
jgi:hypothetical protein